MLLHACGTSGAALSTLTALYDGLPGRPALIAQDPAAAATLVTIAMDAGDRDRAALVVDAARRLAGRNPDSWSAAGAAAHAEGLLHRDPVRLRAAVERFRATPRPLALAAALRDAATAGRDTEGRDTVRGWYDEALTILTGCGATGAQRQLESRLGTWRGSAVPPVVRTAGCLPQLSPAERRVALLVADGLTNIEVAEKLYLSRHTVDSHLRRIFVKLEINRRVELAARVARECGNTGNT
jgi:DNA-binding CsgD family transcriptional regulator